MIISQNQFCASKNIKNYNNARHQDAMVISELRYQTTLRFIIALTVTQILASENFLFNSTAS